MRSRERRGSEYDAGGTERQSRSAAAPELLAQCEKAGFATKLSGLFFCLSRIRIAADWRR